MHVKTSLAARVCLRQTFPKKFGISEIAKKQWKAGSDCLGSCKFYIRNNLRFVCRLLRWRRLKADLICVPSRSKKATFVVSRMYPSRILSDIHDSIRQWRDFCCIFFSTKHEFLRAQIPEINAQRNSIQALVSNIQINFYSGNRQSFNCVLQNRRFEAQSQFWCDFSQNLLVFSTRLALLV